MIFFISLLDNTLFFDADTRNYKRKLKIEKNISNKSIYSLNNEDFDEFVKSLTLKELLVYNNKELYNRYVGYLIQILLIKQKPISQVVKEFLNSELFGQRKTLIQILLKKNNPEYQYLSYLFRYQ